MPAPPALSARSESAPSPGKEKSTLGERPSVLDSRSRSVGGSVAIDLRPLAQATEVGVRGEVGQRDTDHEVLLAHVRARGHHEAVGLGEFAVAVLVLVLAGLLVVAA